MTDSASFLQSIAGMASSGFGSHHIEAVYYDSSGFRVIVQCSGYTKAIDIDQEQGTKLLHIAQSNNLITDLDTYDDDPTAVIYYLASNQLSSMLDDDTQWSIHLFYDNSLRIRPYRPRNPITGRYTRGGDK